MLTTLICVFLTIFLQTFLNFFRIDKEYRIVYQLIDNGI